MIDGSKFRVTKENVSNFDEKMVFKKLGVFEPKEDDEIFIKHNDSDIKAWNKNPDLARGDLIVKLRFKLPRKISDGQMQVLKAIYK